MLGYMNTQERMKHVMGYVWNQQQLSLCLDESLHVDACVYTLSFVWSNCLFWRFYNILLHTMAPGIGTRGFVKSQF